MVDFASPSFSYVFIPKVWDMLMCFPALRNPSTRWMTCCETLPSPRQAGLRAEDPFEDDQTDEVPSFS